MAKTFSKLSVGSTIYLRNYQIYIYMNGQLKGHSVKIRCSPYVNYNNQFEWKNLITEGDKSTMYYFFRWPSNHLSKAIIQTIFEAVQAFNIPIFTLENFEADDIIGTIATKAKSLGHKSYILTGDQDSFQLIDTNIKVKIPRTKQGKTETGTGL